MITLILFLGFITFMLYMGFKLTGALLSAIIWIAVLVPVSIVLFALGLACCVSIILIPVGIKLFGAALSVLIP